MKDQLFLTITFMLTSALGLYGEPGEYGIFRLIDSASRLLGIMEAQGMSDPFLESLKRSLDEEREGGMDDERQRKALERIVADLASELRARV